MILFALFIVGFLTATINALTGTSNGIAVIGILLMAPAVARGMTRDLYIYIPRKGNRS